MLLAAALVVPTGSAPPSAAAAGTRYEVVNVYPHDSAAWTQGLAFNRGVLHESTGLYGRSSVRRVELATGRVLHIRRLPDHLFGEGLAFLGGRAFVLTWKERRALILDPRTFASLGRHRYAGEGWGLTSNGRRLIMSNGSSTIRFRDPATFRVTRSISVSDAGVPVRGLNELEWIDGRIWANVRPTSQVVIVDPASGRVVERIDFAALREREERLGDPSEMNGIAYLAAERRLFITGKHWRHVYEIELLD